MERDPAGQERNGVLRLLSLELIFADERCAAALSDQQLLAAMARFEAALALSSAELGIVPKQHADVIASMCQRAHFDAAALARAARDAGTLAIPFVRELTTQVASASTDAARFVHFGATSQDVIDSALAMCLKASSERTSNLARELGDAAADLARRYRDTPSVARTLLQPAIPVPFGWKVAMWLAPLARSLPQYRAAAAAASTLQFGGAGGTLSAFGDKGNALGDALATRLQLQSAVTWHSARDRFARLGCETAVLTGITAKIARDVALSMQPEIAELAEPAAPGRGGSSSMPHKRNPAGCLLALEAARRAPGLAATLLNQLDAEQERGLGQWQSQWLTLRELACAGASALAAMVEVLRGLQVDVQAMRANLERSKGLAFSEALSLRLSRTVADRLCEQAVREGKHLLQVMRNDAEAKQAMPAAEMAALFEPQQLYGSAPQMIAHVLADWTSARGSGP